MAWSRGCSKQKQTEVDMADGKAYDDWVKVIERRTATIDEKTWTEVINNGIKRVILKRRWTQDIKL